MELNDWILALHLLAAFALIAAEVAFSIMIAALWRSDSPSRVASTMLLARVGVILVGVGMAGTIVFGIWLAIDDDAYHIWDGWILASLILWAISGALGGRAGQTFEKDPVGGRAAGIRFQAISSVLILAILVLMIWKPGA